MEKKPYSKPELTVHGDIEKITLAGCSVNSDQPTGTNTNNDAFPCGS